MLYVLGEQRFNPKSLLRISFICKLLSLASIQPLSLGCRIFPTIIFPIITCFSSLFFLFVTGVFRNNLKVREEGLENLRKVHRTSTSPCGTLSSFRQTWPCPWTCAPDHGGAHCELKYSPFLTTLAKHTCAVNSLNNLCVGPEEGRIK